MAKWEVWTSVNQPYLSPIIACIWWNEHRHIIVRQLRANISWETNQIQKILVLNNETMSNTSIAHSKFINQKMCICTWISSFCNWGQTAWFNICSIHAHTNSIYSQHAYKQTQFWLACSWAHNPDTQAYWTKKNGCFQTAMRLNGGIEKTKSWCLTLCSELPRHKSLELKIKCHSMKSNTSYQISLPRPNDLSYATHTQFISPYFHTMSTIVSFCASYLNEILKRNFWAICFPSNDSELQKRLQEEDKVWVPQLLLLCIVVVLFYAYAQKHHDYRKPTRSAVRCVLLPCSKTVTMNWEEVIVRPWVTCEKWVCFLQVTTLTANPLGMWNERAVHV